MADRKMFWRIIRRIFASNRGRLVVILLALGAGAAVTAALLNLELDAKRRLTTEFRAFGPNVIIAPRDSSTDSGTLPESIARELPADLLKGNVSRASKLFVIAKVSNPASGKTVSAVITGSSPFGILRIASSSASAAASNLPQANATAKPACVLGGRIGQQLHARERTELVLSSLNDQESCRVSSIRETGGPEDDRVEVFLPLAQKIANRSGLISVIEVRLSGTPEMIQNYIVELQRRIPNVEVRPIRQFTEGEARIYNRISGVLSATVGVVLVLTALCVMAAMTNVAMERRYDVGLMKAIGGATRRVLRLFLAEAALLGLAGGLIGAALGIVLSIWLGKQVFGQPAHPRLIVYPVAVALTMIVSIAGAFPLRRLANVRPASVFRGEG